MAEFSLAKVLAFPTTGIVANRWYARLVGGVVEIRIANLSGVLIPLSGSADTLQAVTARGATSSIPIVLSALLTGTNAEFSGNIRMDGSSFFSSQQFIEFRRDGVTALPISTNNLLVSDSYAADRIRVPTNGMYVKGSIVSGGNIGAKNITRQLKDWYEDVSNGAVVDTDLMVYTVAANTLQNNGDKLNFVFSGNYGSGSQQKGLRVVFGNTDIIDHKTATFGGSWVVSGELFRQNETTYRYNVTIHFGDNIRQLSRADGVVTNYTGTNLFKLVGSSPTATAGQLIARTGTLEFKPAAT